MTIAWSSFLLVVLVALVSATVVVGLFAGGIRLLATPREPAAPGTPRDEEFDDLPRGRRPAGVTASGVALLVLAGLVAVFGVVLLIAR